MNMKVKTDTRKLVLTAVLIAVVFALQYLGSFIRFGVFSISLVLVPIVIGAALCGPAAGAILGFAFGVAVLASGDAALFLGINPFGTVVTVLLKGLLAGLAAGFVYRALSKKNEMLAVILAAIVCPVVNTGIFLLGCLVFFLPTVTEWAGGTNVGVYMITSFVGLNFLFEMVVNIILSPVIIRLINIRRTTEETA